jgi:hypothetical protein
MSTWSGLEGKDWVKTLHGSRRNAIPRSHDFLPSSYPARPRIYARRVAPLKQKGDLAELMIAADLRRRGYKVAFPFGEDWDYDLIIERGGALERVQVKYFASTGSVVYVRCYSHSMTNGRVRATKHYTARTVDWIAVWDATTATAYYIPSVVFDGYSILTLRLVPTRNGQTERTRDASDFLEI